VTSSSGWAVNNPVSFTNIDSPGLVAKSNSTTASFTVTLAEYTDIDTVAVIGSDLPSTANIIITAAGYTSNAVAAYTGVKDGSVSTKTIHQFDPVGTSTVTVSITSSTPFSFQRLVIGKRVQNDGIDQSCEQSFEDQSVFDNGPGYTTVDEYNILPSWKAKMSWIAETKWREEYFPLLNRVGTKKALLFVPQSQLPDTFQHEACFGRFAVVAKGEHNNSDNWVLNFTITGLAP
jgi:hypothetical protein